MEVRMFLRIALVTAAVLSPIFLTSGLQAQVTEDDYAAVFLSTLKAFAEYMDVPLDQVVLDTASVGRALSPEPVADRPRLVSVQRMRSQARGNRFHLTSGLMDVERPEYPTRKPAELPPGLAMKRDAPWVKALLISPEFRSDSILGHIVARTANPQERWERVDIMVFVFERKDGALTLVDTRWVTGEGWRW
jgi:hypothetical protein